MSKYKPNPEGDAFNPVDNLSENIKLRQEISRLREAIKEAIEELEYDPSNGPMVREQLNQALKEPK